MRRSRRVEPQPIARGNHDDKNDFEDKGEEADEDEAEAEEEDEDMSHRRQIYETAFDCKIKRSDDNIDDLDRMTHHSLLITQVSFNPFYSAPTLVL